MFYSHSLKSQQRNKTHLPFGKTLAQNSFAKWWQQQKWDHVVIPQKLEPEVGGQERKTKNYLYLQTSDSSLCNCRICISCPNTVCWQHICLGLFSKVYLLVIINSELTMNQLQNNNIKFFVKKFPGLCYVSNSTFYLVVHWLQQILDSSKLISTENSKWGKYD